MLGRVGLQCEGLDDVVHSFLPDTARLYRCPQNSGSAECRLPGSLCAEHWQLPALLDAPSWLSLHDQVPSLIATVCRHNCCSSFLGAHLVT